MSRIDNEQTLQYPGIVEIPGTTSKRKYKY